MTRRAGSAFALAAAGITACVAISGCGGGQPPEASAGASHAAQPPKPVGPPHARESVRHAENRIQRLASSNDCDVVNELNLAHRPDLNTKARCDYLRGLAGLRAVDGEAYGDAAVIDYALGIRTMSLVLMRQPDGLYHVAFPDYFVAGSSVGTKYAHQFTGAALRTVKALRTGDCRGFLANASRELGPGSVGKSQACEFVGDNPVATVFSTYQQASIVRLGGDRNFGFFGIASPGGYLTLAFARETPADYLPEGRSLPKGAPRYGFAGIFLTNSPKKAKGDSG
jgi:hypothetical protein